MITYLRDPHGEPIGAVAFRPFRGGDRPECGQNQLKHAGVFGQTVCITSKRHLLGD